MRSGEEYVAYIVVVSAHSNISIFATKKNASKASLITYVLTVVVVAMAAIICYAMAIICYAIVKRPSRKGVGGPIVSSGLQS